MRITQGTFSFLPDLTDEQIAAQIRYALDHGWAMSVEHTDDPHPRNPYWEMWGTPLFDLATEQAGRRAARGARLPRGAPGRLRQADRLRLEQAGARRPRSASSSTGRRRSRASASTGPRPTTASQRYRLHPYAADGRWQVPGWADRRPERTVGADVTTSTSRRPRPARPRAHRARAGQDADPRDRGAAGRRPPAPRGRPDRGPADAAHVVHRQPGHRQDDGRDADGRHPPPPRLHRAQPRRRGHARRPGRPVRRAHRAEDQGGPQARLRRRPVHRRGVLPLPPRERARLRRRGDRDPAPGDGERARAPGRDPRRLQGPDGRVLPAQPGNVLARRTPHRLPRLHASTSCSRSRG